MALAMSHGSIAKPKNQADGQDTENQPDYAAFYQSLEVVIFGVAVNDFIRRIDPIQRLQVLKGSIASAPNGEVLHQGEHTRPQIEAAFLEHRVAPQRR